jgi:transposase
MPRKPGSTAIQASKRHSVIELRRAGISFGVIATTLNINCNTAYRIWSRYESNASIEDRVRSGRPTVLQDEDLQHLEALVLSNRFSSLAEIKNAFNKKHMHSVSVGTIRRAFHRAGFSSRIAARKPYLSDDHKTRHLEFAQSHQNWSEQQWGAVIFSDEASFQLGPGYQVRVWRRDGERFSEDCITHSVKNSKQSVMVWAAFRGGTLGPLAFCNGKSECWPVSFDIGEPHASIHE